MLCSKPPQRPPLADIRLVVAERGETYEPSDDSFLLADALALESEKWDNKSTPRICLELGVGSGYVIASAARLVANKHRFYPSGGQRPESLRVESFPRRQAALFAVDVSAAAARDASATLLAHAAAAAAASPSRESQATPIASVDVALADLARPFLPRLAGAVDLLLFNPPYVLTPPEEVFRGSKKESEGGGGGERDEDGASIAAAWAGGDRGREVIDRALPLIARFLRKKRRRTRRRRASESETTATEGSENDDDDDDHQDDDDQGGVALVVALSENDVPDLLRLASRSHGLRGEVVAERSADEERLFVVRFVHAEGEEEEEEERR